MHLKQSFKINIAKPIRLKEKVEQFTFISKDFNTPLLSIDRKKPPKIQYATEELNNTVNRADLIDMYRALHPGNSRIYILKVYGNIDQNRYVKP